jgi:fluoride exporter
VILWQNTAKEMAFLPAGASLTEPPARRADDACTTPGTGSVGIALSVKFELRKDRRMWKSILAIALGAALGALLRWLLGLKLNTLFPTLPPGTLASNLIGGYVVGLAIAFFAAMPNLAPEWRLLIITGFCGGLTTFSTFSAEILTLLQQGRMSWALSGVAAHVLGSLTATFAGVFTVTLAKRAL